MAVVVEVLLPRVEVIFVVVAVAAFAAVALNWIRKSFVCKLAYSGALNKLFHCCAHTHHRHTFAADCCKSSYRLRRCKGSTYGILIIQNRFLAQQSDAWRRA